MIPERSQAKAGEAAQQIELTRLQAEQEREDKYRQWKYDYPPDAKGKGK